ncbi:MAG: exosortase B [Thiotrichales bacterium]|nr:MAG: exosortase B [Thiotrichales bacterium]
MQANTQMEPQQNRLTNCWPIMLGLLILYVPTYIGLANTLWQAPENGHGPIILIAALWLISQRWKVLAHSPSTGAVLAASLLLAFGLLLYVLGRSQDIIMFEVGSQIPVLFACVWLLSGSRAVKALWFPILFLIFLVPLPGFVIDSLTFPLKQMVSSVVDNILYAAGYPIGRSGVMLTVGHYQLLVADACSGLNSMYSLSAMGLLYVYLRERRGWLVDGLLLASILPIAFVANIIRVIALVLITYYFGDEAGQGFMHDFAAIAEFMIAMLALFATDYLLGLIIISKIRRHAHR